MVHPSHELSLLLQGQFRKGADRGLDAIIIVPLIWLRELFFEGGPFFRVRRIDTGAFRGLAVSRNVSFHFAVETFSFKGSLRVGYIGLGRRIVTVIPLAVHASASGHIHRHRSIIEPARGIRGVILLGVRVGLNEALVIPRATLVSP